MDSRPIGIFDSGLGGLTAVHELLQLLPHEDLVYFGDTGRVPYGTRSRETIEKYAKEDISFLLSHNVKAILVACGTVSTNINLNDFSEKYQLPILGVVLPAIKKAVSVTQTKKIGLVATPASIRSGAYQKALEENSDGISLSVNSCPLWVPIVEAGRIHKGDPLPELLVEEYLTPLKNQQIDTLILGCTHYPLLSEVISSFMGPDVTLISAGAEAAKQLSSQIVPNDSSHSGSCSFYISDSTESFSEQASLFLGMPVKGTIEKISL